MNDAGLYIHIPFCLTKCPYCHFYSLTETANIDTYVASVKKEMAMYRHMFPLFSTVYFGGGTPSLLTPRHFETLLDAIAAKFALAPSPEITVEVNPADQDRGWYRTLFRLGVTRLVIGVQSFTEADLRFLGRRHGSHDATTAVAQAREAGFDHIGIDLMYGLPHQSVAAWIYNLEHACSLYPTHLSCYELTPEEDTPLYKRVCEMEVHLPGEDEQWQFFTATSAFLGDRGFMHYEVSNYARGRGFVSRHNMNYWRRGAYLGLGPSAHSSHNSSRWWNVSSLQQYLTEISAGRRPVEGREDLSPAEILLEEISLGLRTIDGVRLQRISHDHNRRAMIDALVADGYLIRTDNRITPTVKGMACADQLALFLSPPIPDPYPD